MTRPLASLSSQTGGAICNNARHRQLLRVRQTLCATKMSSQGVLRLLPLLTLHNTWQPLQSLEDEERSQLSPRWAAPGVHPAKAPPSAWQLRPQVPLPRSVPLLNDRCLGIVRGATMRPGIYFAVIGLVVPAMASAQQFHPSMVEVGTVSPREPHVTFDPPFPSAPKVVLSIRDQSMGGTYRGCGVEAKNITATGFDYFPACSARRPGGPLPVPLDLEATWIATLQQ